MSSTRHIFKIALLSHDEALYDKIREDSRIFGVDFQKSYTQTQGAAFAFAHYFIDEARVTAQFWCMDANPQWQTVRNLYLKGASGIILLVDPQKKKANELTDRLLKEFIRINRYRVPIVLISFSDGKASSSQTISYAKEIERWLGLEVPHIDMDHGEEEIFAKMNQFMMKVRDFRAKNVVFQALKLYYDLDAISNKHREVNVIIRQLRQIFTARYYELINDSKLEKLIYAAAALEGFEINQQKKRIDYVKQLKNDPFEF